MEKVEVSAGALRRVLLALHGGTDHSKYILELQPPRDLPVSTNSIDTLLSEYNNWVMSQNKLNQVNKET